MGKRNNALHTTAAVITSGTFSSRNWAIRKELYLRNSHKNKASETQGLLHFFFFLALYDSGWHADAVSGTAASHSHGRRFNSHVCCVHVRGLHEMFTLCVRVYEYKCVYMWQKPYLGWTPVWCRIMHVIGLSRINKRYQMLCYFSFWDHKGTVLWGDDNLSLFYNVTYKTTIPIL